MARGKSAAGDFTPSVRLGDHIRTDHESGTMADHSALIFGDELAVAEPVDLPQKLVGRIGVFGAVHFAI